MKKIVLLCSLLVSSFGFSQQEIKLNIANSLVMRSLDISYEKQLSIENSFGISMLFNLVEQEKDFRYNENMMITPYFRHYFSAELQWNFFGEVFIGINSGKKETVENSNNFNLEYTDAALGIAVGTKYTSKGGLIIDIYGGIGRNLFLSDSPVLVPRGGLNIGWKF
ncbi:MAG: hypothetical protein ACJA17_000906 [Polaribacter sp.]|jgi:hypothetical protein